MTKQARKNFKYLDKIKSIFHYFYRAFIEANKAKFLEGESPTLTTKNFSIKIT